MAFQTLSGMFALPPNILATARRKMSRVASFAPSSNLVRNMQARPTPSVVEATILRLPSGVVSMLAMAFFSPALTRSCANLTKALNVVLYPFTFMAGMADSWG